MMVSDDQPKKLVKHDAGSATFLPFTHVRSMQHASSSTVLLPTRPHQLCLEKSFFFYVIFRRAGLTFSSTGSELLHCIVVLRGEGFALLHRMSR